MAQALSYITGYAPQLPWARCDLANVTICTPLETGHAQVLTIYNPQSSVGGVARSCPRRDYPRSLSLMGGRQRIWCPCARTAHPPDCRGCALALRLLQLLGCNGSGERQRPVARLCRHRCSCAGFLDVLPTPACVRGPRGAIRADACVTPESSTPGVSLGWRCKFKRFQWHHHANGRQPDGASQRIRERSDGSIHCALSRTSLVQGGADRAGEFRGARRNVVSDTCVLLVAPPHPRPPVLTSSAQMNRRPFQWLLLPLRRLSQGGQLYKRSVRPLAPGPRRPFAYGRAHPMWRSSGRWAPSMSGMASARRSSRASSSAL